MVTEYFLPSRVGGHLRRLAIEYDRSKDSIRHSVVSIARYAVTEATEYDNWNGGTIGHSLTLYVLEKFFEQISLAQQREIAETIRVDLNECARAIEREYWTGVSIELGDESDPLYQKAHAPLHALPPNPDSMDFWKPGEVRLFISHRDAHKRAAFELAEGLQAYGISCFVAHDTIQATKEWRREIMNGLETMEAMLVFLTDDFAESPYTNQEVGFALGRAVPIISLKLGSKDPPAFISHEQALKGSSEHLDDLPTKILALLGEKLNRADRFQTAAVAAFVNSPSWSDTTVRFDRMSDIVVKLTEREIDMIKQGFRENDQLFSATYLTNKYERLTRFLRKASGGREFRIDGRDITEVKQEDDFPF